MKYATLLAAILATTANADILNGARHTNLSDQKMAEIRGMGSNQWVWNYLWSSSYPDPWGASVNVTPAVNTYPAIYPAPEIPGSLDVYPAPVYNAVFY